jgi:hypothetical protein
MKPKRLAARWIASLIALFPANSMAQHGTAVVVIWRPQKVVVGTDSMVTQIAKFPPVSSCKIRHYGRFWITASGLHGYMPTGYNIWSLTKEILIHAKSVPDAADAIVDKVSDPLKIALGQIKLGSPLEYSNTFKEGNFLDFVVIGADSEKMVVAGRGFAVGPSPKEDYPGTRNVSPGDVAYLHFGHGKAIEQAYPRNSQESRTLISKTPGDVAIKKLIQIEIDNEPQSVGPPISLLEVTPFGDHWIESGACQDPTSTKLP